MTNTFAISAYAVCSGEIWCFIGAKAKNTRPERKAEGWGDIWTWVGIDADSKLVVSYLVGGRDGGWAKEFMEDRASRIKNRVQITTDGHKAYLDAVENAFGLILTTRNCKRFMAHRPTKRLDVTLRRSALVLT